MGEGAPLPANVIQSTNHQDNAIPSALRDKRGRIIWRLPGNTEEQNLQIGVQNIQSLFLEKFPEFDKLFPREEDGKISADKLQDARQFILDHIGNGKDFDKTYGSSPTARRIGYFNGSRYRALEQSFSPWGINFNFSLPISNEEGLITINEFAGKYGLAHSTVKSLASSLESVARRTKTNQERDYYKEHDLFEKASDYISLPQVDKNTGRYVDESNVSWIVPKNYGVQHDVADTEVYRKVQGLDFIVGRASSGAITKLYKESDLSERFADNVRLQPFRIDAVTKRYVDKSGEAYLTADQIRQELGVDTSTLKSRSKNIRQIEGQDLAHRNTTLYNESDARKQIQSLTELPQIDKITDQYVDAEGRSWATTGFFKKRGFSVRAINSYGKKCSTMKVRDSGGHEVTAYQVDETIKNLEDFYNLPQIDKMTYQYIDREGKAWAISSYFAKKGFSSHIIQAEGKKLQTMRVRDLIGREAIAYPVNEMAQNLNDFNNLPQVDKTTGRYIDENKRTWVVGRRLREEFGINDAKLRTLTEAISRLEARDKMGKRVFLYDEKEVTEVAREAGIFEKRYSVFYTSLDEWIEEFKRHPEWKEKSISDMEKDLNDYKARYFVRAFREWVKIETKGDREKRRELIEKIFQMHRIYPANPVNRTNFSTIDDWLTEFNSHPEWQGRIPKEMARDVESGASAFHASFNIWLKKTAKTAEEREKYVKMIFPNAKIRIFKDKEPTKHPIPSEEAWKVIDMFFD